MKTLSEHAGGFLAGAMLVVALGTGGCQADGTVLTMLDDASQDRLRAIPENVPVVIACRLGDIKTLTALSEGAREVLRIGNAVLLEVPHEELTGLEPVAGVEKSSVWGTSADVAKLDLGMRRATLESWAGDNPAPLSMLVLVDQGAGDIRERIAACGATPRTVAGQVVTVGGTPEALFQMLRIKEVLSVRFPRGVPPSG